MNARIHRLLALSGLLAASFDRRVEAGDLDRLDGLLLRMRAVDAELTRCAVAATA